MYFNNYTESNIGLFGYVRYGRYLAVRDLTSDKYAWTSGVVYNAVSKNKYVRRIAKNMFNDEWNSKIPFCPSELGVNEMRMLTMFVGYDREFYSAIPFAKGSLAVDFRICYI